METDPPRNSRLRLIQTDEHRERDQSPLPIENTPSGGKIAMPEKTQGCFGRLRTCLLTKQTVARGFQVVPATQMVVYVF